MSCDFGVWFSNRPLSDAEAGDVYMALGEEDTSGVTASPAIDAFYRELTALHPELDDVPRDPDLCPWTGPIERSSGHLLMNCSWRQADAMEQLIKRLAHKHGLSFFDPQADTVTQPEPQGSLKPTTKPWWRFW